MADESILHLGDQPVEFLADQTVPEPSVEETRALGNTVEVQSAEGPEQRRRLLQRAVDEGRIVLTFEIAYYEEIFEGDAPRPAGVVCFRMDWETPRDPAKLLSTAMTGEEIELVGRFTLLDDENVRQRPYEPEVEPETEP